MIAASTIAAIYAGDGEADAVDGDRAFHRHVTFDFGRDAHAEPPVGPFGCQARDAANAVHVALDEVAAEFLAAGERTFEIDARLGFHFAERGAAKRFGGKIGGEGIAVQFDDGQTAAVDGDAGRDGQRSGQRAGVHAQARAVRALLQGDRCAQRAR